MIPFVDFHHIQNRCQTKKGEASVRPPAEYLKSSGGGHIPRPHIFFASFFLHLEHFLLGLVPLFIQFYVCHINSGIVSGRENNEAVKMFLIQNTDGTILPRSEFPGHEVPCSELSQAFFCSPIFRFVYHVYLLVLCTKILLLISFYWNYHLQQP